MARQSGPRKRSRKETSGGQYLGPDGLIRMTPKMGKLPQIDRYKRGKGLVIINTGNGKGKTTAALGTALRAAGYNLKVLIIQFVKGSWMYGELESLKKISQIELIRVGEGFVGIIDDRKPFEMHVKAAQEGLRIAQEKVKSGDYDLVVLDEVVGAVVGKLIKLEDLLNLIEVRKEYTDLILTGRSAPQELIDVADMVTEMTEVKHPFQKGLFAKRGIDY